MSELNMFGLCKNIQQELEEANRLEQELIADGYRQMEEMYYEEMMKNDSRRED